MSSISSIDTSQYTTTYASTFESLQAVGTRAYEEKQAETPNIAAVEKETPKVDLNNYYTNVQQSEMNPDVKSQVSQASQNLNNAISAAVAKGNMDPNDVINIVKAKTAYEATLSAERTTSTFELTVE